MLILKTSYRKKNYNASGFTLVEMLVSIALFVTVVTIATGAVLSIFDANRKTQAVGLIMNNLTFAMENMARTLRVSRTYHCDILVGVISVAQDCPAVYANSIAFEAPGGNSAVPSDQHIYKLEGGQIQKSKDGGAFFLPITAAPPEIVIEDLRFYVENTGTFPADEHQPKIIIVLRGHAGTKSNIITDFNLQTTISQRDIDI